jgi:hypothetical protein
MLSGQKAGFFTFLSEGENRKRCIVRQLIVCRKSNENAMYNKTVIKFGLIL